MGKQEQSRDDARDAKSEAPVKARRVQKALTKCRTTGLPIDPSVCLVNRQRRVADCRMCQEGPA